MRRSHFQMVLINFKLELAFTRSNLLPAELCMLYLEVQDQYQVYSFIKARIRIRNDNSVLGIL
jgi:hypothetical protein